MKVVLGNTRRTDRVLPLAVLLAALLLGPRPADAAGDEAPVPEAPGAHDAKRRAAADGSEATSTTSNLARYYPPPVDGPTLRLPESPTRIYLDGAYAYSNDLSALPYIAGSGENLRFAAGGTWRWRRFAFDAEVPFVNVTRLQVTKLTNLDPIPEDETQTAVSLGDIRLGAQWTTPLVGQESLVGGFGLRGRLATHTTRFEFHLIDDSLVYFSLPYYFHVEPTFILGGAFGRFTFVMNQGAIMLVGPDGQLADEVITVPTIYFWDAHYAIAYAPLSFLGASVELQTAFQLNHVGGVDFAKFNDVRAAWVAYSLQAYLGTTRIDAIARLGLTNGQELLGVIEFVGTNSFTLRVTRLFN